MRIGEIVITKYEENVVECRVIETYKDEVKLEYNGKTFIRKMWEINKKNPLF